MKAVKDFVSVVKSFSDERFVCDIIAPGFGKDGITVKYAKVDGGDKIKITVAGKYARNKNADGTVIPRLGFEKLVEDFSVNIAGENGNFGYNINTKDYDLDNLTWSMANGVIRVSVPKTELAKGATVNASDNADATSTGDATLATADSTADSTADTNADETANA